MAKTAGLVLVAVILGVVMLNIIDDGSVKVTTGRGATSSTPTTKPPAGTTSTTTRPAPTRQVRPAQLRLVVFNAGSGVNGAAKTMSDALKTKGYVNQGTPSNATARQGRAVQCRSGLTREAKALATVVGQGAVVEAFPKQPPQGVDATVQCIVLIGRQA